jgi:hypothetical protein
MTETPRPWQPGDPVGAGRVYLPDTRTRRAYGIEVAAQLIAHTPGLPRRRKMIEDFPDDRREQLKARVAEIWKERQNNVAR